MTNLLRYAVRRWPVLLDRNPTPVPSEVAETTAGEREVEAHKAALMLAAWVESLWTIPCAHGGGYARDCTRCIHETLHASDWLAALLDRVQREEGERIAQAIEAEREAVDAEGFGWYEGCRAGLAEAARIARAASVGRGEGP